MSKRWIADHARGAEALAIKLDKLEADGYEPRFVFPHNSREGRGISFTIMARRKPPKTKTNVTE